MMDCFDEVRALMKGLVRPSIVDWQVSDDWYDWDDFGSYCEMEVYSVEDTQMPELIQAQIAKDLEVVRVLAPEHGVTLQVLLKKWECEEFPDMEPSYSCWVRMKNK